ncbi:acyl-homoserine-lactone synthase [Aerolutibacter daejeonensis]|uniref:acyl-homoserine-lactone synthase n=1 Tax=Aerolutibacter daejeonensis TaxID=346181 RepID=UPI00068FED0A|nr:acyl-homoserine-lactone synthase [Lysobacter daejeonensis]
MTRITVARAGEAGLHAPLLDSMFRLRADVFHSRLGWDVRVEGGREHDWFDLIGPHYLVARAPGDTTTALGCCRLLPTLGPNMLRDVFPDLLDGAPVPASDEEWEVSRFAVAEAHTQGGVGFSALPAAMVAESLRFGAERDLSALVGVTSAAFARMLMQLGLQVDVLGTPRRIGRVMSLAFRLPLHARNLAAVGARPAIRQARAA